MSVAEASLALMLALEARTVDALNERTKAATVTVKSATSWDGALATMGAAVSVALVDQLAQVREVAAQQFLVECGVPVLPSGTDDTERGVIAAGFYVKAWSKALGESPEKWDGAVEHARAAAEKSLALSAAFEVCRAWNDEHRQNAKAASPALSQRWATLKDDSVCKACKKLDGTYADEKGLFPGGVDWPPLHISCRCLVITEPFKTAPEGETRMAAARIIHKDAGPAGAQHGSIELPDGLLITRAFEVKAFNEEKRTVDFVASTGVVDAHDEVVDQGTWHLDDYLKNPVVLFAHQSRELPIGQSIDVGILDGKLQARILFATGEMNPKAEQVFQLVKAKFLRAVSVGFIPKSYRYEMREGVEVWVWADCILKEISVTPVPANPEALAKMKSLALEVRAGRSDAPRERSAPANPPTPSGGGPTTPTEEKKETVMTEAEIKALQAAHEKSLLAIAELKLEAKTVSVERDAVTAKLTAVEAQVKTLTTENAAFVAQVKTLGEDRDVQKKRADEAEDKLIDLEVETEIGPNGRLKPAEKDTFTELRRTNPALYAKMIAERTPMNLGTAIIAGVDETGAQAKSLDPAATADDIIAEATALGAA